jgi:hypothetical protein
MLPSSRIGVSIQGKRRNNHTTQEIQLMSRTLPSPRGQRAISRKVMAQRDPVWAGKALDREIGRIGRQKSI